MLKHMVLIPLFCARDPINSKKTFLMKQITSILFSLSICSCSSICKESKPSGYVSSPSSSDSSDFFYLSDIETDPDGSPNYISMGTAGWSGDEETSKDIDISFIHGNEQESNYLSGFTDYNFDSDKDDLETVTLYELEENNLFDDLSSEISSIDGEESVHYLSDVPDPDFDSENDELSTVDLDDSDSHSSSTISSIKKDSFSESPNYISISSPNLASSQLSSLTTSKILGDSTVDSDGYAEDFFFQ
jgi:hypothetical protein